MKGTSPNPAPDIDRHGNGASLPATDSNANPSSSAPRLLDDPLQPSATGDQYAGNASSYLGEPSGGSPSDSQNVPDSKPEQSSEPEGSGAVVEEAAKDKKKFDFSNLHIRFYETSKRIIFHSWINVFLVFVPAGIVIAQFDNVNPGAVFGINAIAIIPLAALLSHATEAMARKRGNAIGALLNVSLGNLVELIIFIIALASNQIRIVQASILGSILANMLLILGMSFVLGGLRFREQVYNSTVTQMSAVLLSLSVASLLLPTVFHASFKDQNLANTQSLRISRATSVILLLVYFVYLGFQLSSHAYMYESTPQHIIDEEAEPGPAVEWFDHSSSSSSSSSSSDSDSDGSSKSRHTISKRVKRAIRRRRRRSSGSSGDSNLSSLDSPQGAGGSVSGDRSILERFRRGSSHDSDDDLEDAKAEDADRRKERRHHGRRHRHHKKSKRDRRHRKNSAGDHQPSQAETQQVTEGNIAGSNPTTAGASNTTDGRTRRIDFASPTSGVEEATVVESDTQAAPNQPVPKRPFNGMRRSFAPVARSIAPVFASSNEGGPSIAAPEQNQPIPRVRVGVRRTNSLPDRLRDQQARAPTRAPGTLFPTRISSAIVANGTQETEKSEEEDDISEVAAFVLLLITIALVATCAEFMVDAIDAVVETSSLGELFIGLIILPIVGNAAEHVTAVTVAMKNKMDLTLGVAVGSSIQIALLITPIVVIIGWGMDKDMTLYFTLFETGSLFVATFIVNFLILDGRSNYLEGTLLCATYIIIAVIAFYYPDDADAAEWSTP